MKKLLSVLGAIGLTATASTAVVSCKTNDKDKEKEVANELAIKQTTDGLWGDQADWAEITPNGERVLPKLENGKYADTLTNLLTQSKDEKVKSVKNYVQNVLGLDNFWKQDGENKANAPYQPVLSTLYFDEDPKLKDGDDMKFEDITKRDGNIGSDKFHEDAKNGGTYYLVLVDANGEGKDHAKVVTIKVTFANTKKLAIKVTTDGIWGEQADWAEITPNGERVLPKLENGKYADTLTNLLTQSKDEKVESVKNYVQDVLGLDNFWKQDGEDKANAPYQPVLSTKYFSVDPKLKDGSVMEFAKITEIEGNIEPNQFPNEAKKGGTYYLVLVDENGKTEGKVVTLQVTFTSTPEKN